MFLKLLLKTIMGKLDVKECLNNDTRTLVDSNFIFFGSFFSKINKKGLKWPKNYFDQLLGAPSTRKLFKNTQQLFPVILSSYNRVNFLTIILKTGLSRSCYDITVLSIISSGAEHSFMTITKKKFFIFGFWISVSNP